MASSDGPFLAIAVFCENAIQDQQGVLSLIRVYQRRTIRAVGPGAPETMPPQRHTLTLVLSFISGAARGRSEISIKTHAPSGLTVSESPPLSILLEGDDRGANVITTVEAVLDQEGIYWFEVLLNKKPVTRVPLRVMYERVITPSPQP